MILDLLEEAGVLRQHEVDGRSLTTETTSTADSVDIVLLLHWELVVDDKTDLLDINTSCEQVSGDKDTDGTTSELLHHDFTLLLVHLSVHGGHDEVLISHRSLQLVHPALSVAVDDCLLDVKVRVQVQQHVNLPLVLLDSDIVLVNTVECESLLLHKNLCRGSHKVLCKFQDLGGKCGREEANLDVSGQELENVLNLGLKTARQHFISFIEDEELEVVCLEEASSNHVVDTARGADNDVLSLLEDADVFSDDSATDASVDLDAQELTD